MMDAKPGNGVVVRHKVERYSCSRCKFHTVSKRQLQRHIKQKHSPGKYVCGECGEKFHRPLMFKLHMTTHTSNNEHSCPTCKKTFPLVSMLKIHQETHSTESIHPCPHCSKQFRQKSALSKHVAFGHTKKNVHPCGICGIICPSPSTLVLHMDSSHKNIKSSNKKPVGEGGGSGSALGPMTRRLRFYRRPNDHNMFKCQRCQRKFFTSYALAKHMEGHHGFQTHKCIECDLDFKTKKALYRHTAMHVHDCDECDKKFRTQEQLETHKKLHTRTELTCTMCGRNFSKGISYRRHMDAHARNPKYQCPECGKNFRRQADLQTHQWLHKGDGFPCEDCGKKFGTKQHLIWHSYIHYSGKKSDGDIKQEKSETDATEETEPEVKTEKVSASGSECNVQNATPKKTIKKEKTKGAANNSKKDVVEEKDKDKRKDNKRQTPSPVKKSGPTNEGKQSNSSEGQEKKSSGKQDVKVEEVKIKKEKVEEIKAKNTESNDKKNSASPAKPVKSPRKTYKRRTKGRKKVRKPNAKSSEEPTATDTDSKVVTGTESERDAQADKQQSEKILTTEEVLLSDDVLQDSNELHDEKELRVDTVMFDDIEDDVELDINAAIETLTKLGSHNEHEVATRTFDDVEIIEEELEQADKDINEDDLVGLEDIANIDTTDKAISSVDIQTLYDMETDNDTAGETEALDVAKATVFCAMQANVEQANHTEMDPIVADDQVISDTSTVMLIESVAHADRLIQTGLYVQNVMGAQDCNTVLEAIETAVQQGELIDPEVMSEDKSGETTAPNLTEQVLEAPNVTTIELVPTQSEGHSMTLGEQTDETAPDGTAQSDDPLRCDNVAVPETDISLNMVQEAHDVDCVDQSSATASGSYENDSTNYDGANVVGDMQFVTVGSDGKDQGNNLNDLIEHHLDTAEITKDASAVEHGEANKGVSSVPPICEPTAEQARRVSGSYIAEVETVSQQPDPCYKIATDHGTTQRKGRDEKVPTNRHCGHEVAMINGEHTCVGGCSKCSAEFGLSINKTVCPHSKELKILIEKLDFKGCPVGNNGEVLLSGPKTGAEPTQQGQKRRRTTSSEHVPLQPVSPDLTTDNVLPASRTPNKSTVGLSRLRRRIRHSSGTKNVSTKCCDTRRKESQLSGEAPVAAHDPQADLLETSPTVMTRSTRSCASRLPVRMLRTNHNQQLQPVKEWRKSPPSAEKKHGRKFTSVLRRKSDSDQLSPPPQYTVSALNDLTIRITTQSPPEMVPSQQKKSPSLKDYSSPKSSKTHEKEESALRHSYGATQELCVVLDDINELVLLQQERLRKLKNWKPVKVGKRVEDLKRRHRSNDLSPGSDVSPKPIKILLRLPKERIRKHEKRLALLDKRLSYNGADANESMEYQQPDSSQDMLHKDKGRLQLPESVALHKLRGGVRSQDTVVDVVCKDVTDSVEPVDDNGGSIPGEDITLNRRVIGSVLTLSNSVLSVEECDSTSMAETQRQASSASLLSSLGEAPSRRTGSRRKEPSPNKEEPLDLTIRYKELSDMEVKPDPDGEEPLEADGDETDDDYCTCDDENCMDGNKKGGHRESGSSGTSPIKVKDDPEVGTAPAGGSSGGVGGGTDGVGAHCAIDFSSADPPNVDYANSASSLAPDGTHTQEAEQEPETPTEYIEVIDRGIQCELGDELLFMPQVPQPITD